MRLLSELRGWLWKYNFEIHPSKSDKEAILLREYSNGKTVYTLSFNEEISNYSLKNIKFRRVFYKKGELNYIRDILTKIEELLEEHNAYIYRINDAPYNLCIFTQKKGQRWSTSIFKKEISELSIKNREYTTVSSI